MGRGMFKQKIRHHYISMETGVLLAIFFLIAEVAGSWSDVPVKRVNMDTSSSSNLGRVNFKTLRVKRSHFTIAPGLLFGNNTNTDEKQLVAKLRLFHHQRLQRAW